MPTLPYQPCRPVTGPAYSIGFKLLATVVSVGLAAYALSVALRFPMLQYGFGVPMLLLGAAVMLGVSYYWFLRSRTSIDANGITQSWLYNRQVLGRDVRGVKMIGIPHAGWVLPPRLVVRTGGAIVTFNGGSQALLIEFAKIALAYQKPS